MSTGIVKQWHERGLGFVQPDEGGADVFVHAKSIDGASVLAPGQRVDYEPVFDRDRGKYRGIDCRVI
jgi:CspA family cold shock protein